MQEKLYRSFDGIVSTFESNIYDTSKGALRRTLIQEDLLSVLEQNKDGKPLNIIDIGCGEGYFSALFSSLGHNVVLCDVSEDMLSKAKASFTKLNLLDRAKFYCANIFDLPDDVKKSQYDLVMCHAMLEWVADQELCLSILSDLTLPNGYLSLLYYNKDALYFQSLIVGNFPYIDCDFHSRHKQKLTPDHPLSPSDVIGWFHKSDFSVYRETGIRVFHDYMRDKSHWKDKADDILRYERIVARDPRFCHLGRYQHILARKDRSLNYGN